MVTDFFFHSLDFLKRFFVPFAVRLDLTRTINVSYHFPLSRLFQKTSPSSTRVCILLEAPLMIHTSNKWYFAPPPPLFRLLKELPVHPRGGGGGWFFLLAVTQAEPKRLPATCALTPRHDDEHLLWLRGWMWFCFIRLADRPNRTNKTTTALFYR